MSFLVDTLGGAVFTELLRVVLEVKKKIENYETELERIKCILEAVTPKVLEIKELNKVLKQGDEETEKMLEQIKKGKELLLKCETEMQGCCSCFKKPGYAKELQNLAESLTRFSQIVMPLQIAAGVTRNLVEVRETREEVHEIHEQMTNIYGEVEEVHDQVTNVYEEVIETHVDLKDIGGKVSDIQDGMQGVKETVREGVKDIGGKVVDIKGGVQAIQEEVKDIQREIKRLNPVSAMLTNIVPLRLYTPPAPPEHTFGLDRPLREIKKLLFKDHLPVVVLSGPRGYGKTTLATKLCQDAEVKAKFGDNIFFINVSRTPNLRVIIQKLFQHKGHAISEFQSDQDAVNQLEILVKQISKPILMVLDDVWSGSEALLDKLKFQIQDYQILVTSRSTLPRFGSSYKLDTLDFENSKRLFCHSAYLYEKGSDVIDDDVVNQVVTACKGFPLALTLVGKSLCRQPAAVWQNRLMEWSKGGFISDNSDLRNYLKTSLDALEKEVIKECYMDLGAFPEGHLIPVTALIDMWVEMHDLDENGLNTIAYLHELFNLNLVNLEFTRKDTSEVQGYYNDQFVMQHDLLRELVNSLSGFVPVEQRNRIIVDIIDNKFPKWWREQKQQPTNARILSISTDEVFSSKWCNLQAPEVEVVVLNFRAKNYTLPEFITGMEKLKTLIVTNYEFFPAEITNFSILGSLPNLKRIRLERIVIPSLNLTSVRLKNLKKISLLMCNINQSFWNTMISEALANLVEINIGYCNNLVELPVGLCHILPLKKLSITYCHDLYTLPKEIGKLGNLEVLRLCSCVNLSELPDTIGDLLSLSVLDISDCLGIRTLPEQIGRLKNLRKLILTGCSNCKLPKSIKNLGSVKVYGV